MTGPLAANGYAIRYVSLEIVGTKGAIYNTRRSKWSINGCVWNEITSPMDCGCQRKPGDDSGVPERHQLDKVRCYPNCLHHLRVSDQSMASIPVMSTISSRGTVFIAFSLNPEDSEI